VTAEQLVDETARETIVSAHTHTLFVEAGAGTGKTTKLVERVVSQVATGYLESVRSLAAITFTENAAAELRTRIREALEDAFEHRSGVEKQRCADALRALDDAAITTLHGFAARLLMDAPLEAGLPPGFGIEDDVRASIERDAWWRTTLDTWLDDPELGELWRVAFTLGLRHTDLERLVPLFDGNWDLLEDATFPATLLPAFDVDAVLAPLRRLRDYVLGGAPEGDRLTQHIETTVLPTLLEAERETDPLQVFAMLNDTAITSSSGSARAWHDAGLDKPTAVAFLQAADAECERQLTAARTAVTTTMLERLRTAVLRHAADRRRAGRLWFHDLLVLSVRLLRDQPSVRAAMHERWRIVLVDEFQDTDPLQVDLVHLIAGAGDADWTSMQVDGGRLFFVGDPKQSIYRFRRAEVVLFGEVRERYAVGEGRVTLSQNFRSRPQIIDVVNAVFEVLLADDPQIPYEPLHAHRSEVAGDAGPDVLLLGGPHDVGNMAVIREDEARHVAATLRRARDERWTVKREGWDKRPPQASYADMAILVPTRTSLTALEDALDDANVPYRVMSRSLVWQTDAVRDLITVLQAADDPTDAVAVVAALRHPMFACSDDDLAAWAVAGGAWRYDVSVPAGLEESPIADAFLALKRYHELRWWLPVNVLLDRIVRERRVVELTSAHRRPRDHWRRVRFLVDQARGFLDSGGSGLTAFLRWAGEQIEGEADAIETVAPERDDDAVQILTIHGSKGLEFPLVALTGINVAPQGTVRVVWKPPGTSPEVSLRKTWDTPGLTDAKLAEKAAEDAEDRRLLYVGMTRAMDHLIVSLHHKTKQNGKADNHAMRLWALLDAMTAAGAVHELDVPVMSGAVGGSPGAAEQVPAFSLEDRRRFLEARHAMLAAVRRTLPTTATGLVAERGRAQLDLSQEPADPAADIATAEAADAPLPRPVARSGATLGTAVHRALELVDLHASSAPEVHAAASAACAELGVARLVGEVERRVRSALASDVVREAAGSRHWKEVPIVAELDGRIIEGVIDLLYDSPDGLVVVDYKTDGVRSDRELNEKAAHYTPQLHAYRDAVARAAGRPVASSKLAFVGSEMTHVRDV
jgi:ATP-dependent helicase/nuclease subunit A